MIIVRFLSFVSLMDEKIKKCPQTETGSQTGAFTLAVHDEHFQSHHTHSIS